MPLNNRQTNFTLNSGSLKLVNTFTWLGSSVSSTENDINTQLAEAWTAIDKLSVIQKSDLSDKIERSVFFKHWSCQYSYMDAPHGRWLSAWRKSLTAITQECYKLYWTSRWGNIPQNSSSTATNNPSRKLSTLDEPDELISDVLPWTPSHGRVRFRRLARTYLQQLCSATGCCMEGFPGVMDDRN